MTNPHPHAENMLLYAQDAAETDRPWVRWEVYVNVVAGWHPLSNHPAWTPGDQYRRKPRTRSLNGHEYPEPERTAPADGSEYWVPRTNGYACEYMWASDRIDRRFLRHGMVHLSKEAAEAHARAIIKAGGGEV